MKPTWEKDGIQLYLGDCLESLDEVKKSDVVITDPPYGISHKSHEMWFKEATSIQGDESIDSAVRLVEELMKSKTPLAVFYSPYKPLGFDFRNVLCWDKGGHVGIGGDRKTCWKRTFEMIGVSNNRPLNGKRDESILCFNAVSPPPSGHFCEKPLTLMRYLVEKLSTQGHVISDPFMGSCSTGEACVQLGRRFRGWEKDERWFEYSVKRIEAALAFSKSNLFSEATL